MEKRNARPSREIVVPGDVLSTRGEKGGDNTYERDGKLYAAILGVKNYSQNGISVMPIGGVYMPSTGDTVIGIINDIAASNWMVDISAPYPAPLHVNEVPWKVEFGDTSKYLNVGDAVLLKILMVDESKKIQVTMNDSGLRKLDGGMIVDVPYCKVSRIIGKSGSMIQMLKNMTDCRIFIGQNGRIWIDGDDENAEVAADAIRYIEENSQKGNLTEKVKALIEERLPGAGEE
ncbi:MAG: RNA-binding protein [Candidatus Methanomethylophilaceae archaeon]|uniref:exosome complex RNA-binding protein Rrp4 n=1 Tax=Candidatus Methanarcanum hacksteinii TaxID=2911857 RepID=UPI0027075B50|nr:RNA-binding protein [Candidatus Methanomethylophilaceae archaeon]MCI6025683.1 exosome complex RNA-binding protein Rrp4 [Methanomassiliicoccales archaeon]MDO5837628.1 exosome complex RNA-binding protein Rrp4 [Methanomassiliicoccales archaeon]MDY4580150.1 exosome complex RNA-binding protein Rrp4 [Candidatus Methanarcanum hacksteinii]TQS77975.1 MAG: RNA-binding protein [Candidatus Methanarcanum hacksteinii]